MNTNSIEDEEPPLDPVMERVRKKMLRLLFISIGIMVIGLMAVLGAIVYKIGNRDTGESISTEARVPGSTAESSIELQAGEQLQQTYVSADRLIAVIANGGKKRIVVIDLKSGEISNQISFD